MVKPELIRENPPKANRSHKTEIIDWTGVLKRALRSNAWYRIDHKFTTSTAAASVANAIRKGTKGSVPGAKFNAESHGNEVWVQNAVKK